MEKKYLNIKECAVYTGFSKETLYRFTKRGYIPFAKLGNRLIRFDRDDIDSLMNKFKKKDINSECLEVIG